MLRLRVFQGRCFGPEELKVSGSFLAFHVLDGQTNLGQLSSLKANFLATKFRPSDCRPVIVVPGCPLLPKEFHTTPWQFEHFMDAGLCVRSDSLTINRIWSLLQLKPSRTKLCLTWSCCDCHNPGSHRFLSARRPQAQQQQQRDRAAENPACSLVQEPFPVKMADLVTNGVRNVTVQGTVA